MKVLTFKFTSSLLFSLQFIFTSGLHAQDAAKSFVVTETAFSVQRTPISSTGLWMWWTAVIQNPNSDYYCASPEVTVTARNASGEVVGTYDKKLMAFFGPTSVIAYNDNLEV